jgi:post-segregation antitoxin (ccd killing protein)
MKLFHVRVPPDLEAALLAKARRLDLSVSAALRAALQAWVADEETTPEPAAPDPIATTSDDTLNDGSVKADEKRPGGSVVTRLWRRWRGA